MTKEERERLRELAMNATPGPWTCRIDLTPEDYGGEYPSGVAEVPEMLAAETGDGDRPNIANAEFVAAANPAVVLELLDEVERLREITTLFAETAEAAVYHAEHKNDGGMRVPFHGDFCSATPSTISRLRWWGKRFREVLK